MPRTRSAPSRSPAAHDDVRTVAFVSLGCPKNLVDSEKMLGLLVQDGIIPTADESDADAIVINTCGFLEASKVESVDEINRAVELKKAGSCKRIIVAGCLVQRHRAKMLEWCPDIDAMIGVFDRDRIVEAVRGEKPNQNDIGSDLPLYSSIASNATLAKKARHIGANDAENRGYFESDSARLRLTPRHYAYLRISEGCNQNCAFCTIPSIRGKMRSKPVDRIVAEARELFEDGAFELNLIGQDTTSYGSDIGYDAGLVGMLTALNGEASLRGGAWVRLMYAYPSCFTDAMIDAIAKLPNVLKYIDMPLQHINDRVLDRMKRKTSRKLIETLLAKLRKRVPGIAIRTTFISGFPGETKAEHNELVAFVRGFGFDAMGVFPYSPEPGTPAGTLHANGGAIDETVIAQRVEELMLTQQDLAFAANKKKAEDGFEFDVLIDSALQTKGKATTGVSKGGKLYAGRSSQQAPQVDSATYVQSKAKLSPGEVVRCKVTDADGYDLVAQPVEDQIRRVSLPIV
jgi:ribosomal protein S12 methylthiotransferase